jgi:hypothetical protein
MLLRENQRAGHCSKRHQQNFWSGKYATTTPIFSSKIFLVENFFRRNFVSNNCVRLYEDIYSKSTPECVSCLMYSSSSTLLDTRLSAVIRLDFRGFLFESQFEVSGTFSDENKRMSFFLKQNVKQLCVFQANGPYCGLIDT